jgi:hypothetical protein
MWLTRPQAADLFKVKQDTLRNWCRRDRIDHRVRHGVHEVEAGSIERYLSTRGTNGLRPDDRPKETP